MTDHLGERHGATEPRTDVDDPLEDPVVTQAVDRALEPYRGMVSEEDFQGMRAALADMLVMHPVTDRLIRLLRPRTRVNSGEERIAGPEVAEGRPAANERKVS